MEKEDQIFYDQINQQRKTNSNENDLEATTQELDRVKLDLNTVKIQNLKENQALKILRTKGPAMKEESKTMDPL